MQDSIKKTMKVLPELFIAFIIAPICLFVGFAIFILCNFMNYNNDITLIIIVSTVLLGSALILPIIGIKAGIFDSVALNENNLTILCLGKSRRIIMKQDIESISKRIGFRGTTFIHINLVYNESDTSKLNQKTVVLSYSPKRMEIINSWYYDGNESKQFSIIS